MAASICRQRPAIRAPAEFFGGLSPVGTAWRRATPISSTAGATIPAVHVLESVDEARIAELRQRGEFFWLDLVAPPAADVREAGRIFGWHELAIEDTLHLDQRPKLDEYGEHVLLVFYGAQHVGSETLPVEVHIYISGESIVTVRPGSCAHLDDAKKRLADHSSDVEEYVIYRVLDALTDSFFPLVQRTDDRIEEMEDEALSEPGADRLAEVFELKRELADIRRIVLPQRDLLASGGDLIQRLPGLSGDAAHDYFRDVYDHLVRISEQVDAQRDGLTGVLEVWVSMRSLRMDELTTRLTVVATIFLPLTFLTGFFGQNFGWLTDHITSAGTFWGFGVGGMLLATLIAYLYVRRNETREQLRG
jgi:magnesium transporter